MRPDFHILVIGGGMVGACAAALAASNRDLEALRVAVLERTPPAPIPPGADVDLRVSAVSRASERILSAIGAWELIGAEHVSAYSEMKVWDASVKPHGPGAVHFSASASSEPNLGYIVENRRIQSALYDCEPFRQRVATLSGELAALEFDQGEAGAVLTDGRRISASLIIGSDGADSPSRKMAGVEAGGWAYPQDAFVTHVRTERSHERTAWQRFLAAGPIAFLPLVDGRSSIVWTTKPEHAAQLVQGAAERVALEIEAAIDGVLGKVEIAGPRAAFPLRLAHARSYCRERFALIGDAAHAVHPLAGQGVNLGFLDCAALIEVLGDAVAASGRDESMAELRTLRRYERWRKSENAIALGLIDGLNRLFGASSELVGWARRLGLSTVNRSGFAKRFFMGRAMGTHGELPRIAAGRGGRS
jgi:2-polyprenylphenol 6-hydroxylase